MGRQKRYPDAEKSINAFYASVSEAYNHPGADEKSRDGRKPQAFLAEEFGISRLKVRKILITTGDVEYPETKRIQELLARGMKKQDVCEYLNMALSTLNSFLPYEKGVYNLADVSIYAESSRIYRERRAAVLALQSAPSSYKLWYDGDADRCLCVDEKGRIVNGDQVMFMCGKYMKDEGQLDGNTIVTTIMPNMGLYKACDAIGIHTEKTAVGDKYVAENMMANGYVLGGEQSGHIIFGKYATTGDGILTSLMVMMTMLDKKMPLSMLADEMKMYPPVLEECAGEE